MKIFDLEVKESLSSSTRPPFHFTIYAELFFSMKVPQRIATESISGSYQKILPPQRVSKMFLLQMKGEDA